MQKLVPFFTIKLVLYFLYLSISYKLPTNKYDIRGLQFALVANPQIIEAIHNGSSKQSESG
jgi:hypothetical protein